MLGGVHYCDERCAVHSCVRPECERESDIEKLSNAITIIIHCVNYNGRLRTGHLFRKINLKLTQTAVEARPLKSLL